MPNKKASRNAYFFFALEMIPELRRRGLPVCGVKDAISYCSWDWALLTVEEKEKYAEKAKEWRNREPGPPSPPRSSTGVGRGKAQHKEEASRHQDQVRCHERLYRQSEGLEKKVIYIINIFSHGDMPAACEQRFVPCEIGCVRYSLQEGIMDSFHDFIDPGELPFGFHYHCQAGSAATHQIPVSGFKLANHNYHELYRSLCDFIYPVPSLQVQIYCGNSDMYRVKWCLQWLAYKAGIINRFELLDVESLILKYFRDKLGEEPSKFSVPQLLDVVHWDYASNTRCKWHEENDMWCCALASCKKVTYCISKALASVYGVTLTPAHLPSPTLQARFQKKSDHLRLNDHLDSAGAACGASTSGMNGAASFIPRRGRGRGILRLLEEMPDFNPTEG